MLIYQGTWDAECPQSKDGRAVALEFFFFHCNFRGNGHQWKHKLCIKTEQWVREPCVQQEKHISIRGGNPWKGSELGPQWEKCGWSRMGKGDGKLLNITSKSVTGIDLTL